MIEYSHENSLTFGYDGGLFNEKQPGSVLSYNMRRCLRAPVPLMDEYAINAMLLAGQAKALGRPVYLLQSGGMDSEVMIKSFQRAGEPFKTITFELANKLNTHELAYVKKFSDKEKLNTQFYKLDLLKWMQTSEAHEYFHLSNCHEAAMLPHMKLMQHVHDDLGGFPVLGGGDVVVLKQPDKTWRFAKYEYILAWYWFMRKMNINGGVAFFQHTPESTLAMLNERSMMLSGQGRNRTANVVLNDLRQVKYQIYMRTWGLESRPKFGGSEFTYAHLAKYEHAWRSERNVTYNDVWSVPFEEFRQSITA